MCHLGQYRAVDMVRQICLRPILRPGKPPNPIRRAFPISPTHKSRVPLFAFSAKWVGDHEPQQATPYARNRLTRYTTVKAVTDPHVNKLAAIPNISDRSR